MEKAMATRKTPFGTKDLEHFRDLLLERRDQVLADIDALTKEGAGRDDTELSDRPLHQADRGSDAYARDVALTARESQQELLVQIDRALEKIRSGAYGLCEETGKPIGRERLEAKPWARFCIEVQKRHEAANRSP
jgi:RNA polymerase-binding protein DksA